MNEWRHVRTKRLWLDACVDTDVEDLFAIHSDPASWRHFPSGVMRDPAGALRSVKLSRRRFERDGLAYWSVRDEEGGPVIGQGGAMVPEEVPTGRGWWNLYYRFDQRVLGRGYAAEMGLAAVAAARQVAPERPVMAYLLEHNVASRRTAEKLGFQLVWRGPDRGNPDDEAIRLVYLDRDPDEVLREEMAAIGYAAAGFPA